MPADPRRLLIQAHLELIAAQLVQRRAERCLKQAGFTLSKNTMSHLLSGRHDYYVSSLVVAAEDLHCDLIVELRPKIVGQK